MDRWTNLAGRVLIALLFVAGTAQKARNPAIVQDLLASRGLPEWLVWPALVFDAAVAVGLVFGPHVRLWAWAAAIYCMATSVFHFIPGDGWQMSIFVKNWAIAGGLLAFASQAPRTPLQDH